MLSIRYLEKEDASELGALAEECFSMPWSVQAFEKLAEDENSLFLVALEDGNLAGGCGLTHILDEGDVHNVMVRDSLRGRGIATALMERLLQEGEKQGILDFTLEVRVSNEPAIRVYEKLGFASEGVRPRFYEKPVEDALIMWRRHA